MTTDTLYRALIEYGPALSYVSLLDDQSTIVYVSPQLKTILGYDPDTWQSQPGWWRTRLHPDDRDRVLDSFEAARSVGRISLEYRYLADDGRIVWVHDTAVLTTDLHGAPRGWQGVIIDVTDRKVREQELAARAFHDPLTHLPNRALLLKRLEHAIWRATYVDGMVALFYLDLDGFKQVNDQLGHALGDQLLIEAAHRISGCLRASDTTSRVGGDEFIVLVEDIDNVDVARFMAERIIKTLGEPYLLGSQTAHVTASLGIALSTSSDAASVNDLLRLADNAMYEAKRNGKARLSLANQSPQLSSGA